MKKKIFISFIIILFLLFIFGTTTILLLNKKDSGNLPMQEEIIENEIVENSIIVIKEENVEKIEEDIKEDSKDRIVETDINKTKEESKQTTSKSTITSDSSTKGKSSTTGKNTTISKNNTTSKSTATSNSSAKGQSNTTSQSNSTQENKQEEAIVKKKSIYDYEFDIGKIKLELISIGKGIGLKHIIEDDGVIRTPSNSSWSNPITASKSFQGQKLERALKDYVRSMPTIVEAYGGQKLEYFTIYVENRGNGSYTFYFLY